MGRCGGRLLCLPRFNLRELCSRPLSANLDDDGGVRTKRDAAHAAVVFILVLKLAVSEPVLCKFLL